MTLALTRAVSPSLEACELTHLPRQRIDAHLAAAQHAAYVTALEALGCAHLELEPLPSMPDAVFVEDTAVVFDELAVVTRPGAASRRAEVGSVAVALAPHRRLAFIEEPGTLDGGDVLVSGRRVYVGRSTRSSDKAMRQLAGILSPFGYEVVPVDVRGCLHLKSAATQLADGLMLINPEWVEPAAFGGVEILTVDPLEPSGANGLRVGDAVLLGASFPRTRERVERTGLEVKTVDLSELAKAEGAVTCCSILLQ